MEDFLQSPSFWPLFLGACLFATPLLGWCWWYLWPGEERLGLPPNRTRCAPWNGVELMVLVLIALLWAPALVYTFYATFRGEKLAPETKLSPRDSGILTLTTTVAEVLTLLVLLLGVYRHSLVQLGLSRYRLGRMLGVGVVTFVCVTPAVHVTAFLTNWVYLRLVGTIPKDHQLTELGRDYFWLVVVLAVVLAPLLEEMLFRGLLQPWALQHPFGSEIVMLLALVFSFAQSLTLSTKEGATLAAFAPAIFVLALLPVYYLLRHVLLSSLASGIFSVALLFASVHSTWPQPIPLFVFALGAGLVAYRTQSLWASIMLHACFNGLTCVLLLVSLSEGKPVPQEETKGNEQTSAWIRPEGRSASSIVPGS